MQECIKLKKAWGNVRQIKKDMGQELPKNLGSLEYNAEEGGRDSVIKACKQYETVPTLSQSLEKFWTIMCSDQILGLHKNVWHWLLSQMEPTPFVFITKLYIHLTSTKCTIYVLDDFWEHMVSETAMLSIFIELM